MGKQEPIVMSILSVSAVTKRHDSETILKDISFTQRKLQRIAIAGETGSGKSTLLKIIAGLVAPDAGEIMFGAERVHTDRLVPGQPGIAYLSQHFELPKFLRVEQVLEYANALTKEEAARLYEICQINHLLHRKTDQLSGGERQRIAMARLLTTAPAMLLLDEPFTHLDMPHKNTLKTVIRDLGKRLGITCILVSHDPEDSLSWADKILVLRDGEMIQQGTPLKVYNQPVNEYVAGLFGRYNVVTEVFKPWQNSIEAKPRNKNFFLRPEHLAITRKRSGAMKGEVERVLFMGSHFELEVRLADQVMVIRSEDNSIRKGDTVYVAVDADRIWTLRENL
jgi:ABC-type sugar transport system ATPase subunit